MGIKSGSKLIWTCNGLTAVDIQTIHKNLKPSSSQCQLDVDVSNIMCILGNGKHYCKTLNAVAHCLKRLAHCGNFFFATILDSNVCPDSKRASIKHKAEREIANIDSFFVGSQLYH